MNNISSDIPKYRKKSQAKPPAKSDHKHVYEPCLIEELLEWYCKPHERKTNKLNSDLVPIVLYAERLALWIKTDGGQLYGKLTTCFRI